VFPGPDAPHDTGAALEFQFGIASASWPDCQEIALLLGPECWQSSQEMSGDLPAGVP